MYNKLFLLFFLYYLPFGAISQLDSASNAEFESAFIKKDSLKNNKRIEFGFNFGVNRTLTKLEGLVETAVIQNKTGVRAGIFAVFNYNEIISFLPKLEVSVNNYKIAFNDTSETIEDYFPMPLSFNLAFHTKFKSPNGKLKPFFTFGPSLKLPLHSKDANGNRPIKYIPNLTLDASIGLEKLFKNFALSPEIRYSHGLINININENIDDIKLHTLSLIINID